MKPYVVSANVLIIVSAEDSESAAELANNELEQIAFDIDIVNVEEY